MDYIPFSGFDIFNRIDHLVLQIEMRRLQIEFSALHAFYFHAPLDDLILLSLQINHCGCDADERTNECLKSDQAGLGPGIVGMYCRRFVNPAAITARVDFQRNAALPTGEDALIERGNRAPSRGTDLVYVQGLIPAVEHLKGVLEQCTFIHFPEVVASFTQLNQRPRNLVGTRCRNRVEVNEKGCCKNQSKPANFHSMPPQAVLGSRWPADRRNSGARVPANLQAMLRLSLDSMASKRMPTKMSWQRHLISVRVGFIAG